METIDERITRVEVEKEELPESKLWWYLDKAVFENRLAVIAVTSSAQGALRIEGFKFGQGKSQFAMALNRQIHKRAFGLTAEEAEEYVKQTMGYPLKDVRRMLKTGRQKRHPAWLQDDWQIPAGKHMSHDKGLKKLAGILSSSRPYVGVFITTQPDLGDIAKCMRDLYMFEIKIPERGVIEIQMIKTWTKFTDPLNPYKKLEAIDQGEFGLVSPELNEWYTQWRDENFNAELDGWINEYLEEDKEKPKQEPNITCRSCGYAWRTTSKLSRTNCPDCGYKTPTPS